MAETMLGKETSGVGFSLSARITGRYWRWAKLVTAGSILLTVAVGRGAVIYDNGPPDNQNGSEMTRWIEADDFVLNQPSRLESVRFWDFEVDGFFPEALTWQIYSDNGSGRPAQLLFSGTSANVRHVATGFFVFGSFEEYVTTFDIAPVSLPAGTYWIGLHNGPLSNSNSENFFWEATQRTSGSASHSRITPFTGAWNSNAFPALPSDLAFAIFGIPTPRITAFEIKKGTGQVSFSTVAGYSYRLDYRDSLSNNGSWTLVPGLDAVPGTGNLVEVSDPDPPVGTRPSRFYRVGFSYKAAGAPTISAFGVGPGGPQVSFNTKVGYYYRVEYKNELGDLSWNALPGEDIIAGTGGSVQVVDSDPSLATKSHRFYRIVLY